MLKSFYANSIDDTFLFLFHNIEVYQRLIIDEIFITWKKEDFPFSHEWYFDLICFITSTFQVNKPGKKR